VAAKDAIRNPGRVFQACERVKVGVTDKCGFKSLIATLPSGHARSYPLPKLVWKLKTDEDGETLEGEEDLPVDFWDNSRTEIQFWGIPPGKSVWGWCRTYGGKMLENFTQAVCGDLLAHGACNAERAGYLPTMLVHDEIVCAQGEGQTHEELCELVCDAPGWADGFPLAAEGATIPYYKK
jgi:DNA polymerase